MPVAYCTNQRNYHEIITVFFADPASFSLEKQNIMHAIYRYILSFPCPNCFLTIERKAGACNNERLIIKLRSDLKSMSVSLLPSSSHYNFGPTYYSLSREVESPNITTKITLLKTNFSKADYSYFPDMYIVTELPTSEDIFH